MKFEMKQIDMPQRELKIRHLFQHTLAFLPRYHHGRVGNFLGSAYEYGSK
jgi:hypothetical protein